MVRPGSIARLAPVLAVVCLGTALAAQTPAAPRLILEPEHHAFGRVATGIWVQHAFRLRNGGNAPLHIDRVLPSCGCTTAPLAKRVLAPGEATDLNLTFNTRGFLGPVHKTVRIESDDPQRAVVDLAFDAEVVAPAAASEPVVRMDDLAGGERRKASVRLQSFTGRPLAVTRADLSDAPWLGVTTRPKGNDQMLDLLLVARRLPPGKLEGVDTLDLHVQNPEPSVLHVEVHWRRQDPVLVEPRRVGLAGKAGGALEAQLTVRPRGKGAVRVLSARSSSRWLEVAGPEGGRAQTLRLRFSPEAPAGTYGETVTLVLDAPGRPELKVPVAVALD